MAEDADWIEDSAVVNVGSGVAISEVEMATNAAAGFASIEIAGVAVALKDHVAGVET